MSPRFDPAAPLPRRTRQNFMATGVGQAAPMTLVRIAIASAVGASIILIVRREWWLVTTPLVCFTCFGSYGILAQRTYLLDLAHERRVGLRRSLAAMRMLAIVVGALSAMVGLVGLIALLTQRGARL